MRVAAAAHILREGDRFYGILLEESGRSEHRSGIEPLYRLLGVDAGNPDAIEGCRARWTDQRPVTFAETEIVEPQLEGRGWENVTMHAVRRDVTMLAVNAEMDEQRIVDAYCRRAGDEEIVGAWSDWRFALAAYSPSAAKQIAALHESIETGDFALWINPGLRTDGPPAGLVLAIASIIPLSLVHEIRAAGAGRFERPEAAYLRSFPGAPSAFH